MNNNKDICRICLKSDVQKDISELHISSNGKEENYVYIFQFCLDIEVAQPTNLSTKLCIKCYKKTLAFHKFKTLALRNDACLKALDPDSDIKYEVYIRDDIKEEVVSLDDHDFMDSDLKSDVDMLGDLTLKEEGYPSDDELLSSMKRIKYELVTEDTKENAPVKKRKGRPKKIKTQIKVEKDQVCEECGRTVRNLKEHMLIHQPNRKQIKCKACDKSFSTYSSRHKHYKTKHLNIKKRCKECNKDVVDLRTHTLVAHNRQGMRYVCVSCGHRSVSQSALDLHTSIHTKDRPYECEHCGNRYRSKMYLLQHIRQVHEKERSHLCQFCSKSFFKKYHLQLHLRVHTREKPHPCPDCGKCFSSTTILRNHLYIHSKDKSFECTLCDMKFKRPGYLRAHMISHTKEKRYPCKYCGVAFHRSDHRKRHQFTAHERHLQPDGNADT